MCSAGTRDKFARNLQTVKHHRANPVSFRCQMELNAYIHEGVTYDPSLLFWLNCLAEWVRLVFPVDTIIIVCRDSGAGSVECVCRIDDWKKKTKQNQKISVRVLGSWHLKGSFKGGAWYVKGRLLLTPPTLTPYLYITGLGLDIDQIRTSSLTVYKLLHATE